jgi:hypothetical protein
MKAMKNIIFKAGCFLFVTLVFMSCNDSFLDRQPTGNLTDNNFWQTANDLKVYNNGIYNEAGNNGVNLFMTGYSNAAWNSSYLSAMSLENQSDNGASFVSGHTSYVKVAAGLENIPDNPVEGGWQWSFLRRCNVFLGNYERANVSESVRNNYAGEVYFFRAWFYLDKVQLYGDVPLAATALTDASPELFEKRTPRKDVMALVLSDINKAIEYLPEAWDSSHPDRVNKYTAMLLKSRICLYEGTYNKYHNLGEYQSWLNEAADAAGKLIESGKYALYTTGTPTRDYRTLFTSPDLHGNSEILLSRTYVTPGMGHRVSGYIVSQNAGPTKDFVDDFLCIEPDGTAKPVALSAVYNEDTYEGYFDNRDPRLSQTVLDPRREKEILNTEKGFPFLKGMGVSWESATGFHFIKQYEYQDDMRGYGMEIDDYPMFRYAEALLNYAEARAELGNISQNDLDVSINKLRDRAGMPHLDLNPPMDPKYASEGISSLLVEIRRERRVELSYEQFRYQDLMRWKKGHYLKKRVLGMRLEDADRAAGAKYEKTTVSTFEVNGRKYVDVYAGTDYAAEKRVFDDNKHYLHPIPVNVMAKNQNLKQNPGW